MAKRSPGQFKRSPNDFYRTPFAAAAPLFAHLAPGQRFIEPCAGHGDLIDHLSTAGFRCVGACDIAPQRHDIQRGSAMALRPRNMGSAVFITNPPWTRDLMHPIIKHLAPQAPTWLLFDADWAYNVHATPFARYLRAIVAVGRVAWFGTTTGKDNAAWYLFDGTRPPTTPQFFLRDEVAHAGRIGATRE